MGRRLYSARPMHPFLESRLMGHMIKDDVMVFPSSSDISFIVSPFSDEGKRYKRRVPIDAHLFGN